MIKLKNLLNEAKVKRFWVFRKDVPKVNKLLYHYFDKNFKFDKMKKLSNGKEAGFYNVAGGYDKIMRVLDRLDKANIHWVVPMGNESVIEGIAIVQEGITKYHIRLTKTPGWYGIWDKNGKQKAEGDRKYITKFLKALKTRMGSFQLKSLVDLATDKKGKDISFDVAESVNERRQYKSGSQEKNFIVQQLVKYGNTKSDAIKMTQKHYNNVLKRYKEPWFVHPIKKAEIISSLSANESINEAPGKSGKDQYVGQARVKVEPYTYKNQKRDFHDV